MSYTNHTRELINLFSKIVLTIICAEATLLGAKAGFSPNSDLGSHYLYSFCHANIWHLAINLYVLWKLKNYISPLSSYMIAVAVSFLPMYVTEPTLGLSGFLFASIGQMWGRVSTIRKACKIVLPFVVITMIIPNANGLLHLYAFLLGYLYSFILAKF